MANKSYRFVNLERGTVLAQRTRVADSFISRLVGLLLSPPLEPGEGLLITPCNSIHMFGMRFPIDVVFFDKKWKVVGLLESIAPGQMSKLYPSAHCCVELRHGAIADSGTMLNDQFQVDEV